ncbi:MAG TPA: response regulator [Candidatus Angelobacter sp.]|nr:response regulator [Candidatus Angelobacter sp.]
MAKPKLLFVDDEASIRKTLPVILTAEGFECTTVGTVSEAISEISRHTFDILLSDLNIGEPGDGFIVVGAMRRVQPHARTYILTGYPDFTSALEAIRRQVDGYLVKPADISTLLQALRTTPERSRILKMPGKRASTLIRENSDAIIEKWAEETESDQELKQLDLDKSSRIDHLPGLLRQLANRLDKSADVNDKQEMDSAQAHGKARRDQGYSIPLVVAESRILYKVIADTIQTTLVEMDISSIIPDLIMISDSLNAMLAESLRSFLSAEEIAA